MENLVRAWSMENDGQGSMDELIVGTYEGFLLGYSVCFDKEIQTTKLKQTFATHSHTAAVRCISIAGKFLASGGTDDKVVIIDLKTRKEHTVLMNHDGTINAVSFTHNGTHLLTGSDDGSIIVTRTGNWQIEKIWKKAHGGQRVIDIVVHPSDKLALSIGGDKTLRTWNLIKGRPAFTINIGSKGITMPTEIKFSPDGDRFSLVSQQTVDLWTVSKAGIEKHITCNSKPTSVQWESDEKIYVGLDNGNILAITVSDMKALTYKAHKERVKSLHYENNTLYSVSSSGELKVWSTFGSHLNEICSMNASCRVTCVTLNRQSHVKKEDETNQDLPLATSDNNTDEESEVVTVEPKKKGALVTISYEDEIQDSITENTDEPPAKKLKKRKGKKTKKSKV